MRNTDKPKIKWTKAQTSPSKWNKTPTSIFTRSQTWSPKSPSPPRLPEVSLRVGTRSPSHWPSHSRRCCVRRCCTSLSPAGWRCWWWWCCVWPLWWWWTGPGQRPPCRYGARRSEELVLLRWSRSDTETEEEEEEEESNCGSCWNRFHVRAVYCTESR